MNKTPFLKNRLFIAVLMLLVTSCYHSSETTLCNCPVYPIGGRVVGQELANLDYSEYPNTWEWIGRINKLRQELEICHSPVSVKNIPE